MLKGVFQHDESDCGAACIATICKFYGLKIPLSKIRQMLRVGKNGTSLYDITSAFENLKIKATALKGNIDELRSEIQNNTLRLPLIAHIISEDDLEHFIVIIKIKNTKIYFFDPACGEKKFELNFFNKIWTGYIIACEKMESFTADNMSKGTYLKYIHCMLKQKKLLLHIIIFSGIITSLSIFSAFSYKIIIDNYVLAINIDNMLMPFVYLLCIYFLQVLFSFIRSIYSTIMSQKIEEDLMTIFVRHIPYLSIAFFNQMQSGEILSRFNSIMEIENILSQSVISFFLDSFMIVCGGIILFCMSPNLFGITIIFLIIYILIVFLYRKSLNIYNNIIMKSEATVVNKIKELLDGIETIKALCAESFFVVNISMNIKELLKNIRVIRIISDSENNILMGIEKIGMLFVLFYGCMLIKQKQLSLGTLLSFESLMSFFINPFLNLVMLQPKIQEVTISMDRLDDILEIDTEQYVMRDISDYKENNYTIKFNGVMFKYDVQNPIINNASLEIEEGNKVVLVGESGAGKSTFVKLLLAFNCPCKGSIFIGKTDIKNISITSLRKMILYIPQDTYLFHGTIRDNILLGLKNVDELWFNKIIEGCLINKIFETLPYGINTMVGEKGHYLSGGERQRIALARAILKKPYILIIDEGTSQLDKATEFKITKFILEFLNKTTCIFISHGIDNLKECDKFLYLKDGDIKVYQSYDSLANNNLI